MLVVKEINADQIKASDVDKYHTIVIQYGSSDYGLVTSSNYENNNYASISTDGFTYSNGFYRDKSLKKLIDCAIEMGNTVHAFNTFKEAAQFLADNLS